MTSMLSKASRARRLRSASKPARNGQEVRERIVAALNNPRFRMRTLQGIAQEARLSTSTVVQAMHTDAALANTIKLVPIRTQDGRLLVTTKDRFANEATWTERFVDFFATRRPQLPDVA
ncbi:hypothetical protein E7V67_015310 [[Empedobacter] haloabium]|uniref:Winged helix-turn-helix domain-containing protein n=1 Tax=[Empedobacter] haloabium TaxID=592317 RepID=A0ABZ1UE31_9BURK